jgi:hypothetical protein
MTPIRLVTAFALLLVATTAAQAGSPLAAPVAAGVENQLPKLELGLSELDYASERGQVRLMPQTVGAEAQDGARNPSLAQYLKAPAPYGQLLPQPIEDRGVGYRVWF